jgi:DNA-binding CsgD family transcriptional regulator
MRKTSSRRLVRARQRLRALVEDLCPVDPAPSRARTATRIAEAIGEAFDTASCVYRVELTTSGYGLELCAPHAWPGRIDLAVELDAHLKRDRGFFGAYDPLRPDALQRNVAFADRELAPTAQTGSARVLYERLGIADLKQMRMLVCDDAMLLAWVGGFREESFSETERLLLQSLAPALRARLCIDRMLGVGPVTGIDVALEAIDAPAFIVARGRSIAHANAAGGELLGRRRAETLRRIDGALARPGGSHGDVARPLRIDSSTSPPALVVLRAVIPGEGGRLEDAARRWRLTARERDVLAHLARGDANKDIATKLGCAVATVEIHVSAILRKARADSRARIVARYWTGE